MQPASPQQLPTSETAQEPSKKPTTSETALGPSEKGPSKKWKVDLIDSRGQIVSIATLQKTDVVRICDIPENGRAVVRLAAYAPALPLPSPRTLEEAQPLPKHVYLKILYESDALWAASTGPEAKHSVLRLCKMGSDGKQLETVEWEQERKCKAPTLIAVDDVLPEKQSETRALRQHLITGLKHARYEIFQKTSVLRWRLDLNKKTGHSVIYCMCVLDVILSKWMLYVGQAKSLASRFYSKAQSASHLADILYAIQNRKNPELLLKRVQLVDLVGAASLLLQDRHPVYLYVLETVAPANLDARELHWIRELQTTDLSHGLNCTYWISTAPAPNSRLTAAGHEGASVR